MIDYSVGYIFFFSVIFFLLSSEYCLFIQRVSSCLNYFFTHNFFPFFYLLDLSPFPHISILLSLFFEEWYKPIQLFIFQNFHGLCWLSISPALLFSNSEHFSLYLSVSFGFFSFLERSVSIFHCWYSKPQLYNSSFFSINKKCLFFYNLVDF